MVTRRLFLSGACLAPLVFSARAQDYPARAIRVIVPFSPGGSTDTGARIIIEKMSALLKQTMVVENRAGAFTQLGARDLAEATPDGYTLGYLPDGVWTMAAERAANARPELYDPHRFTPIGLGADSYFALIVRRDLPVASVGELAGYGKANPEKLSFASGNPSGILLLALLNRETGAAIRHIPYWKAGEPDAIRALLSGTVQGMFATTHSARPFIQSGDVKALGVPVASPFLPGVQTLAEQGLRGFERLATWGGLFGPPELSPEIVWKLNTFLTRTLIEPSVRERLAAVGLQARSSRPEQLGELVKGQFEHLVRFVREHGIELS